MDRTSSAPVTISVPARAEFIQLLRTVAGAAAARHDLTYDAIEDLRIAVDEACAQLLRTGGSTITLRVDGVGDGVDAEVTTDAPDAPWPPDGIERSLAWQVLKGLSDEVGIVRSDGGPIIRIRKRGIGTSADT